jgi:Family of unknown function (DUF6062)
MSDQRTQLPARNLSDVHLAELLDGPGCPICHARVRAVRRYLEGWMWESVNDVGLRERLEATRGFCAAHVDALMEADERQAGSRVGSAILLDAMVAMRSGELRRASAQHGSRSRARDLEAALRPPDCLVCETAADAERNAVEGLLAQLGVPGWAEAVGEAPFCVGHIARLMRAARDLEAWRPVERRQLERLEGLRGLLARFLAHSASDTRHLRTDDEVAATVEAARVLGASVPDR